MEYQFRIGFTPFAPYTLWLMDNNGESESVINNTYYQMVVVVVAIARLPLRYTLP